MTAELRLFDWHMSYDLGNAVMRHQDAMQVSPDKVTWWDHFVIGSSYTAMLLGTPTMYEHHMLLKAGEGWKYMFGCSLDDL